MGHHVQEEHEQGCVDMRAQGCADMYITPHYPTSPRIAPQGTLDMCLRCAPLSYAPAPVIRPCPVQGGLDMYEALCILKRIAMEGDGRVGYHSPALCDAPPALPCPCPPLSLPSPVPAL